MARSDKGAAVIATSYPSVTAARLAWMAAINAAERQVARVRAEVSDG